MINIQFLLFTAPARLESRKIYLIDA